MVAGGGSWGASSLPFFPPLPPLLPWKVLAAAAPLADENEDEDNDAEEEYETASAQHRTALTEVLAVHTVTPEPPPLAAVYAWMPHALDVHTLVISKLQPVPLATFELISAVVQSRAPAAVHVDLAAW